MRGSIKAFFRPAGPKPGAPQQRGGGASGSGGGKGSGPAQLPPPGPPADAGPPAAAPAAPQEGPALQQFARKRKRPSGNAEAAAAAEAAPAQADAADEPGGAAAAAAAAAPAAGTQQGRPQQQQLTQMYLDVGQRHFHSYRCPSCGMLYARGTDTDERLHAAYHAAATQGPRYSGWQGERVVELDGSRGRVLMFAGVEGQGRGRKQLQELCGFLEEQMGLPTGWLLQAPAPLTVFLYVSAARRVQAFMAAEPVKTACHVRPTLPAAVQGMRSCGSAAVPCSSSGGGGDAAAAGGTAEAGAHVATSGRSATFSSGAAEPAAERSSGQAAAAAAAAAAAGPSDPQRQSQHFKQQQRQQQPAGGGSAAAAAAAAGAPPPLELDREARVRAVCGVRLMWVSLEARRRGLAARLLDCCRCQFSPGYVLPRHQLAFSAPTDAGRAFIEAYSGTRRFLVYE